MHPLEQHYVGGSDYALASFGLEKVAIMSPQQREAFLAAHRAKPKGMAAIQAQSTPPVLGSVMSGAPSMALDRSGYQGGYGTPGIVPGATLGARGQVTGLPNKMAAFLR